MMHSEHQNLIRARCCKSLCRSCLSETAAGNRNRRSGFTLIELLVVALIVAVMAGIVVPAFSGLMEKSRFDAEVRRLQDIFAYAREKAIDTDSVVVLRYDIASETFLVQPSVKPPLNDLPQEEQESQAQSPETRGSFAPRTHRISDNFRLANFQTNASGSSRSRSEGTSETEVRFQGDGTTEAAELVLTSANNRSIALILRPATGRLEISEDSQQESGTR